MVAKARVVAREQATASVPLRKALGNGQDESAPRVLRLTTDGETAPEERVPIFSIDEDEYTILAHPGPALGLKYMKQLKDNGPGVAAVWALETLLGEDAYIALMNYDRLTQDQLDQVMQIAVDVMLGEAETPKEPSGTRKSR